jgi:acetyl-CoA carboxylase biotin carboxyl carrier protein
MNFKEIKELISLLDSSNINELDIEQENFKISIRKGGIVKTVQQYEPALDSMVNVKNNFKEEKAVEENTNKLSDLHIIKSPIVGAFYSASSPEAEPFVKAGSKIKKGDVLCIIEAMKLMNEINSDVDGEIVEVLVKNQELVEFGQPLFSVRTV